MIRHATIPEEEYNIISKMEGVEIYNSEEPEVTIEVKEDPQTELVYNYYKKISETDLSDENLQFMQNMIDKFRIMRDSGENIAYESVPIVELEGYQFKEFDTQTTLYKGLVWFYDQLPKTPQRMWLGNLAIMEIYLRIYHAGILAYKPRKPMRSFILNKQNTVKLYEAPETPANIKHILSIVFGAGVTFVEQARMAPKPLELEKNCLCYPTAEHTAYLSMRKGFRFLQQDLFEYIEQRFNCRSTYLPIQTSPFYACALCEITVWSDELEIDYQSEYCWTTWPLNDKIKRVKHILPYFSFKNTNMRMVRWFSTFDTDYYTTADILSINVHMLQSTVDIDANEMIEKMNTMVRRIAPKILCLQECPKTAAETIRKRLGYQRMLYAKNGSRNDAMVLVCYTNIPCAMRHIDKKYDLWRSMISVAHGGKKFLFVHGPIGTQYFNPKLMDKKSFYDAFAHNLKLRSAFIDDVIAEKPDFVIGDMNMLPIEQWHISALEAAGYDTDDRQTPTSINAVKVDWAWYQPAMSGKTIVYPWIFTDHRPVGFLFDKQVIHNTQQKKHGGVQHKHGGVQHMNDNVQHMNDSTGYKYIADLVLIIAACIICVILSSVYAIQCLFNLCPTHRTCSPINYPLK